MNIKYIFYRVIRRAIPPAVADFFLRKNFLLKISLGTTNPEEVVKEYEAELSRLGRSLAGKKILEFGYGGSFGTAVWFLNAGASHIFLYDKFISPNNQINSELAKIYSKYFLQKDGLVIPNSRYITVLTNESLNNLSDSGVDIVVSRAVLEHVERVAEIIKMLAERVVVGGVQLHFIDLRDHFFKYPYEMLCYGDSVWKNFLNPCENLNRLRIKDYMYLFGGIYKNVSYRITDAEIKKFETMKVRIKKQFLSGNDIADAAERVWIAAF